MNRLIRQAFEAKLYEWAAASFPNFPLVPANVEYDRPTEPTTYGVLYHLPSATDSLDLQGVHRLFTGVYQITFVIPSGKGVTEAESLSEQMDNLFPMSVPLVAEGLTVYLLTPFSAGVPVQEPDAFSVAVSCTYRADSQVNY